MKAQTKNTGAAFASVPARAFLVYQGLGEPVVKVIMVTRGLTGYTFIAFRDSEELAQAEADRLNGGRLAPEVAEACLAGSMFGWHVPAANPANYVPGTTKWRR